MSRRVRRRLARAWGELNGQQHTAVPAAPTAPVGQAAPTTSVPPEAMKILQDIRWELQEQRKYLEMFRHLAAQPVLNEVRSFVADRQLDFEQTLHALAEESFSFARFGDGELRSMLRPTYNLKFQRSSPALAADLRHVLAYDGFDRERLLVGFPYAYRDLHWSGVWLDIWPEVIALADHDARYGNSHVSRPVCFQQLGEQAVELWRKVWQGRRICVVTGRSSRFELVPALFDNVAGVRWCYSVPIDAYADLDRLRAELLREDPDQLFLVALGPAGTVLSAWLSTQDRRAIDIGHISDSWANVFAGAQWPESLAITKPRSD